MDLDRLDHIDDVETLRAIAKSSIANWKKTERKLAALERQVEMLGPGPKQLELKAEIVRLKQELATKNKLLFGKKSEKRGRGNKKRAGAKQTGHGPTEQPELPQVERVHDLDEADRVCPKCGSELGEWVGQAEESEEIDVVERQYVLVKHRRKKYRCRCGECIETAPSPKRLIAGGRYSLNFAAQVAVDKYADHLPLERQTRIMKRHGLEVGSQTLWDQIDVLAKVLAPAYERLHEHLLSQPVVGADETHWQVTGKGKKNKRWQVWAVAGDDGVAYRLEDSRSAHAADKLLQDYDGTVVCDGYSAYAALKKKGGRFQLAHCWAHVRRKFVEIEESFPDECREIIELIGKLYEVEREARDGPDVIEERRRLRAERSRDIVKRIERWALQVEALPQSPLRKAVDYMGSLWKGLVVFLDDPEVDIDNNGVERALRGVVVGRKNHYGSKSRRGTEVAAVLYSMIESAKLVGLDPDAYLRDAAERAVNDQPIPLPHELAAE